MQESFIFYKSYSDAAKQLPEAEQLKALWAIINHSVDGEEQQIEGLANIVYTMAKPQIEANAKRRTDGSKGGRPANKTTGFENAEPNVNVNLNNNVNENINGNENVNDNVNIRAAFISAPENTITFTVTTPHEKIDFTEKQIAELERKYPGVDILRDFEKMQGNIDNMSKCNLRGDTLIKFILNWFDRTQRHGGNKNKKSGKEKDADYYSGVFEKAVRHSMKNQDMP